MAELSFTVDAALAGQRLDKALAALLPELGLRARRRLWENGAQVLVNGKACPPGHAVMPGDCVALRAAAGRGVAGEAGAGEDFSVSADRAAFPVLPGNDAPRFLEAHHDLLFFYKPAGLHSVRLPGGRGGASLEDGLCALLPHVFPRGGADDPAQRSPAFDRGAFPTLLNRLDCHTSGLVLAAAHAQAAQCWHEAEDAGQCRKTYVALLTGTLAEDVRVTNPLDTRHRRVTRVLPACPSAHRDGGESKGGLRHTVLHPVAQVRAEDVRGLAPWSPSLTRCPAQQPLTLALCGIRKGARHQIRAHAAHAGFPLWGDARYGGAAPGDDECFVLHHSVLAMPFVTVQVVPPWLSFLPEKIANNITQSLKMNKILW